MEQTLCLYSLKNWGRPFLKAFEGGFEKIIHIEKSKCKTF
jgi:hypothetical protein